MFIKRRWTLANLTFIFPLASCFPPVLNYLKALTCLKLAHNTLFRLQWILLFQIHIFRTWLCFPKYAITVGVQYVLHVQNRKIIHFLRHSCLYLVVLDFITRLYVNNLFAWLCIKEVVATRSVQALLSVEELVRCAVKSWLNNKISAEQWKHKKLSLSV